MDELHFMSKTYELTSGFLVSLPYIIRYFEAGRTAGSAFITDQSSKKRNSNSNGNGNGNDNDNDNGGLQVLLKDVGLYDDNCRVVLRAQHYVTTDDWEGLRGFPPHEVVIVSRISNVSNSSFTFLQEMRDIGYGDRLGDRDGKFKLLASLWATVTRVSMDTGRAAAIPVKSLNQLKKAIEYGNTKAASKFPQQIQSSRITSAAEATEPKLRYLQTKIKEDSLPLVHQSKPIPVPYSYLDGLDHMNQSKYIELCLDELVKAGLVPAEDIDQKPLRFAVSHDSQVILNEEIVLSIRSNQPLLFYFVLKKTDNNQVLIRAELEFVNVSTSRIDNRL